MKKNAMDVVDYEEEKRKDPKYKTELCKSWEETGFCVYGNRCRFAHGLNELNAKEQKNNYKTKQCKSFMEHGYCQYGSRCNFIHKKQNLSEFNYPYYSFNLIIKSEIVPCKRLKIFQDIANEPKNEAYSSDSSTNSNDDITLFNFNWNYKFLPQPTFYFNQFSF